MKLSQLYFTSSGSPRRQLRSYHGSSDPKTGWQLNGSAIYVFNFENEATDYLSRRGISWARGLAPGKAQISFCSSCAEGREPQIRTPV